MRITNNMMVSKTVWTLNKNMERLSKAQTLASSPCKIELPSDDPVVATRAIKYRNYVAKIEQYQQNAADAASWQSVTEGALSDLGDVVKRLKELTVQASSDTLSDTDKASIKTEVEQLQEQVVDIMNTTYADRYIFAGYDTDEAPYAIVATEAGNKVTYKGQYISLGGPMSATLDASDISDFCSANTADAYQDSGDQAIKYNIGFGTKITVNVEGHDVIGTTAGSNLFDTIAKLLLGLDGATTYQTATLDDSTDPATVTVTSNDLAIDSVLTDLQNDYDRLLNVRADLGARMSYVEMAQTRLSNNNTTYTKLQSENEDVDVAEASINLATAQYVYQASLMVGSKVLSKSLVDYMT